MKLPAKIPLFMLLAMLAAPLSRSETVAYKFQVFASTVSPLSVLHEFPQNLFLNGEFAYDTDAVGQTSIDGVTSYFPLEYVDLNWTGQNGTAYDYSFYSNSPDVSGGVYVLDTPDSSGLTIAMSGFDDNPNNYIQFTFQNTSTDVFASDALPTSIDPNDFPESDVGGSGLNFGMQFQEPTNDGGIYYIGGPIDPVGDTFTSVAPPPGFPVNAPEPSAFLLVWGGALAAGILWLVRRFTAQGLPASAGSPIRD